jgi:hypothetical protein
MPDVLIVGAGVAGASAAQSLAAAGWNVTVVDKAARPGGRCATRRIAVDADSPWFDYGAQYFTARDPDFRAHIEPDLANGALQRWQPAVGVAQLKAGRWQIQASPDERERLIGPHGLNLWVRHLFEQADIDVRCKHTLAGLRADGDGWRADFVEPIRPLRADAVLVTTPAVQAATLLGERAADIAEFHHANDALSPCHSLVVAAPPLAGCDALFVKDGQLSWCADNRHKAGAPASARHRLWTLHAGPEFSAARLEETPESIAAALTKEFAAISGFGIRDMKLVRTHRWRYARPGPTAPRAETRFARSGKSLVLAGDWLAGGRVEGAWLSGRAAAQALL